MGMGLSPPLPVLPPQCPPPLRVRHYPPSSPGGRTASLGTGRRRLSGPRPQNAGVPRSGRCVCPRHTVFGLSLARVAALTTAAWMPPVAYGVRPVPAPCDLPRPGCFGPLSAAPPPHLAKFIISTEAPPHLTSFPLRVHLLALSPHFGLRWPMSPPCALPRTGRHSHCSASA